MKTLRVIGLVEFLGDDLVYRALIKMTYETIVEVCN